MANGCCHTGQRHTAGTEQRVQSSANDAERLIERTMGVKMKAEHLILGVRHTREQKGKKEREKWRENV